MGESVEYRKDEISRELREMAASIGSVVQAAEELGVEGDTPLLELSPEVFERANDIYEGSKPQ